MTNTKTMTKSMCKNFLDPPLPEFTLGTVDDEFEPHFLPLELIIITIIYTRF